MAEKNKKDQTGEQEQDLSQILQVRRDKLAALQAAGKDPFQQTKFTVSAHAQEIKDHFEEMEGQPVTIAGRLMSKRGMGKVLRPAGQVRPHPTLRPKGRDGRGGLQRV